MIAGIARRRRCGSPLPEGPLTRRPASLRESRFAARAMTATAAGTKSGRSPGHLHGPLQKKGNRSSGDRARAWRRNPNCYGGGESVVLRTEPPVDEITRSARSASVARDSSENGRADPDSSGRPQIADQRDGRAGPGRRSELHGWDESRCRLTGGIRLSPITGRNRPVCAHGSGAAPVWRFYPPRHRPYPCDTSPAMDSRRRPGSARPSRWSSNRGRADESGVRRRRFSELSRATLAERRRTA